MITIRIIAFGLIAAGVVVAFINNTNRWAMALQQYFIKQPKNMFANKEGWRRPAGLIVCKAMVIFLAFMLMVGTYMLCFAGLGQ